MNSRIEEAYTVELDNKLIMMKEHLLGLYLRLDKTQESRRKRIYWWIDTIVDVMAYISVAQGKNKILINKITDLEWLVAKHEKNINSLKQTIENLEGQLKFEEK